MLLSLTTGPTPVVVALERIEQIRGEAEGDRRFEVSVLRCQALLRAMRGELDAARGLIGSALALSEELGSKVAAAGVGLEAGRVELMAGRPDAAEHALRPAFVTLENMGDRGHLVTLAPVLADALLAQGNAEEAAPLLELTERWAIEDDIDPQIARRRVQAKLLAGRGEFDAAEKLGREAVELAGRTDFFCDHAFALEDLAEVLQLAGRGSESRAPLEHALRLYDQKGNLVSGAAVRAKLGSPPIRGAQ